MVKFSVRTRVKLALVTSRQGTSWLGDKLTVNIISLIHWATHTTNFSPPTSQHYSRKKNWTSLLGQSEMSTRKRFSDVQLLNMSRTMVILHFHISTVHVVSPTLWHTSWDFLARYSDSQSFTTWQHTGHIFQHCLPLSHLMPSITKIRSDYRVHIWYGKTRTVGL